MHFCVEGAKRHGTGKNAYAVGAFLFLLFFKLLFVQEEKEAMIAAALELERQKAELQARRHLEFQRQKTKSLEVAAQRRQQEEEVRC